MQLTIEYEQEEDGRWIAEVLELPGVLVYGESKETAITKVQTLALRVLAERSEQGEASFALRFCSSITGKTCKVFKTLQVSND